MSRSRGLDDWVDLAVGIFAAIVVFIVVDVFTEGAIEDALVGAISPFIGGGWTALLELVLLILAIIGLFYFLASLAERVRNG